MLIKACQSLCQREGSNSEDLFTAAVTTGKLIIGYEKFLQFAWCFYNKTGHFSVDLLDLRLVLDSSARNFWRKKVSWEQTLQAGVWLGKSRNFLPCKNFLLYDMKCNDLTVTLSVWPGLWCSPSPQYWGERPHPPDSPPDLPRSVPLTAHPKAGVKRQRRSVIALDYICTETSLLKVIYTILSHYTHRNV